MACKTYELKVDKSHLSKETLKTFQRLFLEAKWFYNSLVERGDVFNADYRVRSVMVKNKDGEMVTRDLWHLSSQMRQEIVDRTRDSVRSLGQLKKRGHRVGGLKFKSRVGSIPLKQYGRTYRVFDKRVTVQGIKHPIRVRGLDQIPRGVEYANATLEQKGGDYLVHVTTYQNLLPRSNTGKAVGIDSGIKHQLTLSSGLHVDETVPVTKKIRRLHRRLSRRKKRSKNWFKTAVRMTKEYGRLSNQRVDIRNKVVSKLVSVYDSVAFQDDDIAGWQRIWGRRVTTSAIGGIMSDLKNKSRTPFVVGKYEPTTQECSNCGTRNSVDLSVRLYLCVRCGLQSDRDLNAAINIWKKIPAERRESTPVDMKASIELLGYFNGIPNVSASLVEEAGSRASATEPNGPYRW